MVADKTPRLAWDNAAAYATSVLSASSTQPTYPLSFLRDPNPTMGWRSKVGWTVVAGFNAKIDFTEAGAVRVGTITAGTYATGAAYAAAVKAAMDAAAGAVNTYTVTYDSVTRLFTIARATGAAAVVLTWITGTNTRTSAGPDLGFLVADSASGTSFVGVVASYQSRHFLKVQLLASAVARTTQVVGHNLSAAATVTWESASSDSWTTPPASSTVTGDDIWNVWTSANTYLWHRLVISDVSNADAFAEVAVWFVGPYLEPSQSIEIGYEEGRQSLGSFARAEGGTVYRDIRPDLHKLSASMSLLTRDDRTALLAFFDEVGVGGAFFLAEDPQNLPWSETRYVVLASDLSLRQSVGDGVDRYSVAFEFVESV